MPGQLTAEEIIDLLELAPLAGEGGYYRQTMEVPNPDPVRDEAPLFTAILYLVTPESWSGLHMLETDELFHFYMGDDCEMVVCSRQGELEERRLGIDLRTGSHVQSMAPGGSWQGTRLAPGGHFGYALLGTTMAPGFRPDQFVLATEADLRTLPDAVACRIRPFLSPQAP